MGPDRKVGCVLTFRTTVLAVYLRGTSLPSDTLGREFDPGKRDFSH